MLTASGWVGEGSAVEHLLGTGVEPQQEAPLLGTQAVIEAVLALSVSILF